MSWETDAGQRPWAFDLLALLRRVEALNAGKPRLGDSASLRDEVIDLGQIPHITFAAANVARYTSAGQGRRAHLLQHALGMLGPMGPLPTSVTEEALAWFAKRDDAFCRFLDIFNDRFIQLFYRAFADARPGSTATRPADDRFAVYVGSAAGVGGPLWRGLDAMPDGQKLATAGLMANRAISAAQIESLIAGCFGQRVEIDEFMGLALQLAPDERTRLGRAHARLGQDAIAGAEIISVDHKFRLRIFCDTLAAYERFLPGGAWCRRLVDTLGYAVGHEYAWDVELVLPEALVRPARLSINGRLGWTSFVRPPGPRPREGQVSTRFSPAALAAA